MEDENTPKRPVTKRANLASPFSAASPHLRKPLKNRCLNEGDVNLEATMMETTCFDESSATVDVSLLKPNMGGIDECNEDEKDNTISEKEEADEKDETFSGNVFEDEEQKGIGASLADELGSLGNKHLETTSPSTAEQQNAGEVSTAEVSDLTSFITASDAPSQVCATMDVSLLKPKMDGIDECNKDEKDNTIAEKEEPDEKDATFSGDVFEDGEQKDIGVSLADELGSLGKHLETTSPSTAEQQNAGEVSTAEVSEFASFTSSSGALSQVGGFFTANDNATSAEAGAVINTSTRRDSVSNNASMFDRSALENFSTETVHEDEPSLIPESETPNENNVGGGVSLADELSCLNTETPKRAPEVTNPFLGSPNESSTESPVDQVSEGASLMDEVADLKTPAKSFMGADNFAIESALGNEIPSEGSLMDELAEVKTPLGASAKENSFATGNTSLGGSLTMELAELDADHVAEDSSDAVENTKGISDVANEPAEKENMENSTLSPPEDTSFEKMVVEETEVTALLPEGEFAGNVEAVGDVVESSGNVYAAIENTDDRVTTDEDMDDTQDSSEVIGNANEAPAAPKMDDTIELDDSPMVVATPGSQEKRYIPSPIFAPEEDEESDTFTPLPVFSTTTSPQRNAPRFSDSLIEFVMLENNIDREQSGGPPPNDSEHQLLKARIEELEKALSSTEQKLDAEVKARDLAEKERSDYQFIFEDQAKKTKNRMQMLNQRIMALETELEEARESGEKGLEREESLVRIGELEAELERMKTELEMAQKRGAELQAQAAEGTALYSSQFQEKEEVVSKLELLLVEKEKALEQAQIKLEETRQQSEETAAKASDLQVLVEAYEEEKAQLEHNLDVVNQKMATLATEYEVFDKEREEDATVKDSLEKELAAAKSTVQSLREQLDSISQEKDVEIQNAESTTQALEAANSSLDELREQLRNLSEEKDLVIQKAETTTQALEAANASLDELREQLRNLTEEKDLVIQKAETTTQALEAANASLDELRQQLRNLTEEKVCINDLTAQLASKDSELVDLRSKLAAAQKESDKFVQSEVQKLRAEAVEKNALFEKAQALAAEKEEEVERLNGLLLAANEQKDREVSAVNETIAGERAAFKTEMDQLQAEVSRLSASREELKSAKLRCVELTASNKVLEKKTEELASVKEELERANEAVAQLEVELKIIDADRETYAAKVKHLEKEVAKKTKEATDSAAALVSEKAQHAMMIGEKDAQIEELKQCTSKEFEVRINDLTVQLASKDSELVGLRSKLAAAQKESEKIAALQSEVQKLTAEALERNALFENAQILAAEKEEEVERLNGLLLAAHEQKTQLEALTSELDSKTSEVAQLTAKNNAVEEELAKLTSESSRLKAVNDDLEKEVRERRRSAVNVLAPANSAEMDQMKKKVEELEEQLQKSKRECERYLNMCDEFDDIENELKKTIAEKSEEILRLKIKAGEEKAPVHLLDTLKQGVEEMPPGSVENSPVSNKTLPATTMRASPASTSVAHTSAQNAEKSQCKQQ